MSQANNKKKVTGPVADSNLPNWGSFLSAESKAWHEARLLTGAKKRVLIATAVGGGTAAAMAAVESLLAVALTMHQAEVHILLCDGALPACKNLERRTGISPRTVAENEFSGGEYCRTCQETGRALFDPLGLPVHRLSAFLGEADRTRIAEIAASVPLGEVVRYTIEGAAVGEHALAGALRYFARGDLEGEPEGEAVLRRFFEAALLTELAMRRLLAQLGPEVVVSSHGLYVPYGIVAAATRAQGKRYVAWNVAYRKQRLIFSHGETYHHALLSEPTGAWDRLEWNGERERALMDYLDSRIWGTNDWIWFHEKPELKVSPLLDRLGVDPAKPLVGLLTNVIWDAQLHYRANAFPSMTAWVLATIEALSRRPDLQLLIRIHPAELRGTVPSTQRVADEIARLRPTLPANVFVVGPEEPVSTYALMQRCSDVLIYGTKTGVELASYGIPVIVAGEAWIRNKGLTRDASTPEEYQAILSTLPSRTRMSETLQRYARQYAYHFFFRRMIKVDLLREVQGGWPPFQITLENLAAAKQDAGLAVICSGIMEGTEFIFDE